MPVARRRRATQPVLAWVCRAPVFLPVDLPETIGEILTVGLTRPRSAKDKGARHKTKPKSRKGSTAKVPKDT